jgi:outer membrane receptor protein involved in Fe transport
MGAARYGHSVVRLRDRLGTELTGDHRFSRLNSAAGIVYELPREVSAFGSYGIASRVPTPSELSCADPDDPCRLPNAFVADPPLQQVVAATWEGGLRGQTSGLSWTGSAFSTTNRDDLVFISSGALTNEGHFANVGDTTRRGLEINALGRWGGRVEWSAAYTYLRAQFQTPLTLPSPNHPDEIDGEIAVAPGASLPNVPRHNFKTSLSVTAWDGVFGANLRHTSSQFFRGDEANLLPPIEGYSVVDLVGRRRLGRGVSIVGELTNLFDAEYSTFGLFGEADEVLGDGFDNPRFVGPGAPRAAWIGLEIAIR